MSGEPPHDATRAVGSCAWRGGFELSKPALSTFDAVLDAGEATQVGVLCSFSLQDQRRAARIVPR